jgi:hypothetical protein
MTDQTGFSVGMSVNPTSTFKPLPDWVAFDLCHAYSIPGGNVLLHNTRNDKRQVVKPELYASLQLCSQFKTLDQHTAAIIELNPEMQGQQADISKVLQQMVNSGIMLSAKSVCDKLRIKDAIETEALEDTAPIVAILTWERPQALERLLESIASNCDTAGIHRLYVIDDSRKTENISQNQAITEQFASRVSSSLHYFGRTEQQSLLGQLKKQLPEHESAIRFLIDPTRWADHWSTGLARNLALLLSCGRRLVMLDDDVICDVYDPPRQKPDISFSDSPREAEFYENEPEWAHLQQPINPDPISRHMQCLGLTVPQALNKLGQNHLKPAGLANATALELSELQLDSAILTTECGSLGCPGTGNNTWLPDMAPASLKRMLTSGEKTTQALVSRKVWSGRNRPHFAPRANMSQITGFDNRQMLPPYLPIMRGQDRLFGNMLDFIFPLSVTLDYPWAVPHSPMPERQWQDRDLNFKSVGTFPGFFVEKVIETKSACQAESAVDRLSFLATWFSDLAATNTDSLRSIYRDSRLRSDSARLQHLADLLATTQSAPVNWQNFLRNGISQLNSQVDLTSREDFETKGWPTGMEGDELIGFWKDVWGDFATSLNAWPQIRSAATKIADTM